MIVVVLVLFSKLHLDILGVHLEQVLLQVLLLNTSIISTAERCSKKRLLEISHPIYLSSVIFNLSICHNPNYHDH